MGLASVRRADADDAAVIAGLQLSLWNQAYARVLPAAALELPLEAHTAGWRARLDEGGPALLAFEGTEPVGFAAVSAEIDSGTGDVELLGVLPRWSRRGHGGRLLGSCAAELRTLGAQRGRYWILEADDVSARFLTAAGWAPLGSRRQLDTGDGLLAEVAYGGSVDLILV